MAILNNLIVKGDTRFIGEAGGDFAGTFNGFDLQMGCSCRCKWREWF